VNNKFRLLIPQNDEYINIPIEIKWDFEGRDESIDLYEEDVLREVIGIAKDFEIARFSHVPYQYNNTIDCNFQQQPYYATRLQYQFFFFSGDPISVTTSTSANWVSSYMDMPNSNPWSGFSATQLYYFDNPFTKSFFKLDFYDSNTATTQTNYFTVILPVQQGLTETAVISSLRPPVQVKIPTMNLDFVGDKEGFFLYWLRKKDFLDIDTFYMSAKFFDGRKGEFIRMLTRPQSSFPSKFQFDPSIYFYYKVELDYDSHTYKIFDILTNEPRGEYVPFPTNQYKPVSWYEFINPE
jgi:hypothetical protein